jgi:hypothetical protein
MLISLSRKIQFDLSRFPLKKNEQSLYLLQFLRTEPEFVNKNGEQLFCF